jgi:hypothetical protein
MGEMDRLHMEFPEISFMLEPNDWESLAVLERNLYHWWQNPSFLVAVSAVLADSFHVLIAVGWVQLGPLFWSNNFATTRTHCPWLHRYSIVIPRCGKFTPFYPLSVLRFFCNVLRF